MRILSTIACAAALTALALPAMAADATGKWEAAVQSPRGEVKYTFDLTAAGDKLTGKVINDFMGETEIQDGKIDGDQISFKQVMQRGDRSITFDYSGKINGDELELTRTIEGGMGPGGKGGPGGGQGGPGGRRGMREMTITAKRVQ